MSLSDSAYLVVRSPEGQTVASADDALSDRDLRGQRCTRFIEPARQVETMVTAEIRKLLKTRPDQTED